MSLDESSKEKRNPQQKTGVKHALEGVLERLREGLEGLADGLRPQPQPVPIPIPVRQPRRR